MYDLISSHTTVDNIRSVWKIISTICKKNADMINNHLIKIESRWKGSTILCLDISRYKLLFADRHDFVECVCK